MSLIVDQESIYLMIHIFKQLRHFYTDFYCSFYFKGKYKIGCCTVTLHFTCLKKTFKTLYYMKIMVCKISPGGAKPFLAVGLFLETFFFSFLTFPKFAIFAKFSKKKIIMFYHFYWCLASAISMVHSDIFIFDNVIRITLKVPSIRIILSIGN